MTGILHVITLGSLTAHILVGCWCGCLAAVMPRPSQTQKQTPTPKYQQHYRKQQQQQQPPNNNNNATTTNSTTTNNTKQRKEFTLLIADIEETFGSQWAQAAIGERPDSDGVANAIKQLSSDLNTSKKGSKKGSDLNGLRPGRDLKGISHAVSASLVGG